MSKSVNMNKKNEGAQKRGKSRDNKESAREWSVINKILTMKENRHWKIICIFLRKSSERIFFCYYCCWVLFFQYCLYPIFSLCRATLQLWDKCGYAVWSTHTHTHITIVLELYVFTLIHLWVLVFFAGWNSFKLNVHTVHLSCVETNAPHHTHTPVRAEGKNVSKIK